MCWLRQDHKKRHCNIGWDVFLQDLQSVDRTQRPPARSPGARSHQIPGPVCDVVSHKSITTDRKSFTTCNPNRSNVPEERALPFRHLNPSQGSYIMAEEDILQEERDEDILEEQTDCILVQVRGKGGARRIGRHTGAPCSDDSARAARIWVSHAASTPPPALPPTH
jgi:hypothetical protein